jgi:hypothetical protein
MTKTKIKKYQTKKRIKQRQALKLQASLILTALITASIAILAHSVMPEHAVADVNPKRNHIVEVNEMVEPVKLISQKPDIETQIREIAKEHNFKWPDYLIRLAMCESSLNPFAVGDNGYSRGLFQIHKGYHPTISDEQAFNIRFATEWTMNKINKGQQHLWSCDRIIN